MQSSDFVEAMELERVQKVFGNNWRLITHYDSDHVHAHVIAFRNTTIQKQDFTAWTNEAKGYLTMVESERIIDAQLEQELKQQQELSSGWERGRGRSHDDDYGLG